MSSAYLPTLQPISITNVAHKDARWLSLGTIILNLGPLLSSPALSEWYVGSCLSLAISAETTASLTHWTRYPGVIQLGEQFCASDTPVNRTANGNGALDPDDFGNFFASVYNNNSLLGISLTPGNYSVGSAQPSSHIVTFAPLRWKFQLHR